MASFRTELRLPVPALPPHEAVTAAAHGLVSLGYVLSSTAHHRAHLRLEGGYEARHDADRAHMVTIAATGRTLVFEFEAPSDGFFGDTPFSALGRRELEARARHASSFAFAQVHSAPAPQPVAAPTVHQVVIERQVVVTRCKYCGHLTPVDLAACQGCGGAKFC